MVLLRVEHVPVVVCMQVVVIVHLWLLDGSEVICVGVELV